MKVYALEKGMVLCGKSGEIMEKLKQLETHYTYISEWTAAHRDVPQSVPYLKRVK